MYLESDQHTNLVRSRGETFLIVLFVFAASLVLGGILVWIDDRSEENAKKKVLSEMERS